MAKNAEKVCGKEQERKDVIITFEGARTLNRFTQIHNDTTLKNMQYKQ